MLKNYFKLAWRNLKRDKAYAIINVVGLSLGIACSILIFCVVNYHLSFDNFHNNKDRIFRIVSEFHEETTEYQPGVPQPLGKAFRNDYAFAEKTARVMSYKNALISFTDGKEIKKFQEDNGVAYAEPEFFSIFNFPLIQGNKNTVLIEPYTALITQNLAKKYFGTENAIGKIIRYDNKTDFKITGILKNIPGNTDRRQEIYLSYENLKDKNPWFASDSSWTSTSSSMNCFVLLKQGVSKDEVEKIFPSFVKKYFSTEDAKVTQFTLQPLSDIHFNTNYDGYANKNYLWALSLIGLFLIITACLNFINLATAQALNRSKEVGVRKVLGSLRSQLFWQFIIETTLISLFSILLAYALAQSAMPYLNNLFKTKITINVFENIQLLIFLFVLFIIVVFLSGSYPGLVLTKFKPALALKGKLSQKNVGGFSLRRILVVTQFAISQILIIGTFVIAWQMKYSKNSDLGFNKDAIVMLPVPINDEVKMNTLKTKIETISGVEKISLCYQAPAASSNSLTSIRYANRSKSESWEVNAKDADDQYISTFGLKLAAGRNFFPSDTLREFLVNETFVKKLGLKSPQEIIGKIISINGETLTAPVVGVVKDFYNNSFHSAIDAICIMPNYKRYSNCSVKIHSNSIKPTLTALQKIWNDTYPEYLYSYQFLDDRIAKFYELDDIMLKLVEAFAGIAIFIGCLGLYGLISFIAVRKTKEIGVRKVLGASVQNILWLFGKEFSRLVIIAFIIAAPVAWWAMNLYLQDFTYRIQISAGIFILAILSTFIVSVLTVGYRSLKAAIANPVKSLRME